MIQSTKSNHIVALSKSRSPDIHLENITVAEAVVTVSVIPFNMRISEDGVHFNSQSDKEDDWFTAHIAKLSNSSIHGVQHDTRSHIGSIISAATVEQLVTLVSLTVSNGDVQFVAVHCDAHMGLSMKHCASARPDSRIQAGISANASTIFLMIQSPRGAKHAAVALKNSKSISLVRFGS